MRLRPAASQAASTRAAILPDITERSTTLPVSGRPWRSQAAARTVRRLSAMGGRRWVPAAFRAAGGEARRDLLSVVDVVPVWPVGLSPAGPGGESGRVWA